jgi:hypothetical protein
MVEIVNLRMIRKRTKRQQDERRSEAKRLAHGQPKSLRRLNAAKRGKATRDLDQHRIETGDGR